MQVQPGVHAQLLWGFTDSTLTVPQGLMPWCRWCNLVTGALVGQAAVMWTVCRGPGGREHVAGCRSWGLQSYSSEESPQPCEYGGRSQDPKRSTAPWHLSAAWWDAETENQLSTQTLDPQVSFWTIHILQLWKTDTPFLLLLLLPHVPGFLPLSFPFHLKNFL